ncbi:DgyrCDS375 [Dimorphilus gyrociliatus]|uniref:DgyrCDS375 n=1 Tax=Dimorphilus gyrociliatus TaxID=2664684 RepID=A0A7I8V4G8_9ANNE|nr:DgyrCDS375 [Dimorphilus gyrociliatus]
MLIIILLIINLQYKLAAAGSPTENTNSDPMYGQTTVWNIRVFNDFNTICNQTLRWSVRTMNIELSSLIEFQLTWRSHKREIRFYDIFYSRCGPKRPASNLRVIEEANIKLEDSNSDPAGLRVGNTIKSPVVYVIIDDHEELNLLNKFRRIRFTGTELIDFRVEDNAEAESKMAEFLIKQLNVEWRHILFQRCRHAFLIDVYEALKRRLGNRLKFVFHFICSPGMSLIYEQDFEEMKIFASCCKANRENFQTSSLCVIPRMYVASKYQTLPGFNYNKIECSLNPFVPGPDYI